MNSKQHDQLSLIFTCLAFGGLGAGIIMCLFIGFGFHTVIGKEAIYTTLTLQGLDLAIVGIRERRFFRLHPAPTPSKKARRLYVGFLGIWCAAVALLLFSLILAICGTPLGNAWVKLPCTIGTIASPIGWLGLLFCFHRKRQAANCSQS